MISLAIFIIGGSVLGASAGALGWWSLKKQHEHQQTGKLPESPPHDAAREASADVPTKKVETPAAPTHKMSPPKSESLPIPKGPRLGMGPDAYKDLDDAQVGQWAMEEADKIEELANQAMQHNEFESYGSRMWRFTNKFKDCCTQDVTELRNEILRRLGPPAKDPDEIQAWTILFPEVKYPIARDTINPVPVRDYAPYLRRLGLRLKRRAIPRSAPLALQFSEQQLPAEQPGYSRIVVSIETKREFSSGFIAVQFNGQPYSAGCDFGNSKLPLLSANFIDNRTVAELLKVTTNYVLQIDKTLEQGKVLHVEARATSPIHVSAVTYFEE